MACNDRVGSGQNMREIDQGATSGRGRPMASCGRNLNHPMATLSDRLPLNVAGRFYVDSSCIDCDQCRNEAPEFFGRDADSGTSYLIRQPDTAEEVALVQQAATNCATGSIGDDGA